MHSYCTSLSMVNWNRTKVLATAHRMKAVLSRVRQERVKVKADFSWVRQERVKVKFIQSGIVAEPEPKIK